MAAQETWPGRREDPRFLTGSARYVGDRAVDDITVRSVLVIRSEVAHGWLRSVTASGDLGACRLLGPETFETVPGIVPIMWTLGDQTHDRSKMLDRRVRYVGQPIALLIGPSRAELADAVELINVEIDPLPAVATIEAALADDAQTLHDDRESNLLATFASGDDENDVRRVIEASAHQRTIPFRIGRLAGAPMEPRGLTAEFSDGRLTVWSSTQAPHAVRDALSSVLGWPRDQIRVVVPDVGGGFGVKDHAYDDELMVAVAAVITGQRLSWSESRSESLTVTTQARDETFQVTVGFEPDGRVTAMWAEGDRNAGGHFSIFGGGPLFSCFGVLPGPYDWERIGGVGRLVATNQVPTAAYRGFGQTQACLLRERTIDIIAADLGLDPVDVRLANMISPVDQPYATRTGLTYDGGDYAETVHLAREAAAAWPAPPDDGRRYGVGYATYVQMSGLGPSAANAAIGLGIGGFETAIVRMDPDGRVEISVGTVPHGQGHETSFPRLVACRLGIDESQVRLAQSDTDRSPYSAYGTAASRSMAVGGAAIVQASAALADDLRRLAAYRLEANPSDIELVDGVATVRGSGRATQAEIEISELARQSWRGLDLPPNVEPGLARRRAYDPINCTFGFGTHVCRVAVDPHTGATEIERFHVVQDCGTVVDQTIVDGQTHGAIAQGAGAALLEEVIVDRDGTPNTGSFLSYLVPGAGFLPEVSIEHTYTPAPDTPGGMKGIGEGGTNGSFAAVVNAIAAACPEIADQITTTPVTPERLWRLLQDQGSTAAT